MKISDECYGVIINPKIGSRIRRAWIRHKCKKLGFTKNDKRFRKHYGLDDLENCETWSRPWQRTKRKGGK